MTTVWEDAEAEVDKIVDGEGDREMEIDTGSELSPLGDDDADFAGPAGKEGRERPCVGRADKDIPCSLRIFLSLSISSLNSRIIASFGSSLILGLFLILFARLA